MGHMEIALLVIAVLLAVGAAVGGYLLAWRRAEADAAARVDEQTPANESLQLAIDAAVRGAVTEARLQASSERDAAVQAALEQTAVLQREQFGALANAAREQTTSELSSKKDVIDPELDQVRADAAELTKLSEMVTTLGRSSAENFGQVNTSLQAHAEIASTLADSTRALREALANPQARGQWGERMAEDVLRLAGLRRGRQLRQADADRRRHRPPRLHLPAAQRSRAVHGRQVPAGELPAVPRRGRRRRTRRAPREVPRRRERSG